MSIRSMQGHQHSPGIPLVFFLLASTLLQLVSYSGNIVNSASSESPLPYDILHTSTSASNFHLVSFSCDIGAPITVQPQGPKPLLFSSDNDEKETVWLFFVPDRNYVRDSARESIVEYNVTCAGNSPNDGSHWFLYEANFTKTSGMSCQITPPGGIRKKSKEGFFEVEARYREVSPYQLPYEPLHFLTPNGTNLTVASSLHVQLGADVTDSTPAYDSPIRVTLNHEGKFQYQCRVLSIFPDGQWVYEDAEPEEASYTVMDACDNSKLQLGVRGMPLPVQENDEYAFPAGSSLQVRRNNPSPSEVALVVAQIGNTQRIIELTSSKWSNLDSIISDAGVSTSIGEVFSLNLTLNEGSCMPHGNRIVVVSAQEDVKAPEARVEGEKPSTMESDTFYGNATLTVSCSPGAIPQVWRVTDENIIDACTANPSAGQCLQQQLDTPSSASEFATTVNGTTLWIAVCKHEENMFPSPVWTRKVTIHATNPLPKPEILTAEKRAWLNDPILLTFQCSVTPCQCYYFFMPASDFAELPTDNTMPDVSNNGLHGTKHISDCSVPVSVQEDRRGEFVFRAVSTSTLPEYQSPSIVAGAVVERYENVSHVDLNLSSQKMSNGYIHKQPVNVTATVSNSPFQAVLVEKLDAKSDELQWHQQKTHPAGSVVVLKERLKVNSTLFVRSVPSDPFVLLGSSRIQSHQYLFNIPPKKTLPVLWMILIPALFLCIICCVICVLYCVAGLVHATRKSLIQWRVDNMPFMLLPSMDPSEELAAKGARILSPLEEYNINSSGTDAMSVELEEFDTDDGESSEVV